MSRGLLAGAVVWLCHATVVAAAEPVAASPAELQKIVQESADKYVASFAAQDVKALTGLFTDEAEYVDASGVVFHGSDALEAEFVVSFADGPAGRLEIELLSIRPIAPGLVVEEGLSTFIPAEDGPQSLTRYTATHVRQTDGTWRIASLRELASPHVTPHDRLLQLAWLLGAWHEEVNGTSISTEWKWDDSGNFLVSHFAVAHSRDRSSSGTHRIGWDAERRQFRSWIFDVSGAVAEGTWRGNEDGSWSLGLTRIEADGQRTASRLTYAADGPDAIVVTQDDVIRNGSGQPGLTHRIVRQPPAPAITGQR